MIACFCDVLAWCCVLLNVIKVIHTGKSTIFILEISLTYEFS